MAEFLKFVIQGGLAMGNSIGMIEDFELLSTRPLFRQISTSNSAIYEYYDFPVTCSLFFYFFFKYVRNSVNYHGVGLRRNA